MNDQWRTQGVVSNLNQSLECQRLGDFQSGRDLHRVGLTVQPLKKCERNAVTDDLSKTFEYLSLLLIHHSQFASHANWLEFCRVRDTLSLNQLLPRRPGEAPEDLRKASVTAIFKKGKKEDPGLVNLTLISTEVL
ncbi:hypothetical protein HGM15179_000660 [Zosterops borbonicus]|uniref:Uncharacterized protein n=1 Tax=Zosterops borbonicus TaxID=364589 RepID=A0A8K1GY38_9PASS|nr:hypothetical protein HGM15179_000660 [Zosterops borbonicus]